MTPGLDSSQRNNRRPRASRGALRRARASLPFERPSPGGRAGPRPPAAGTLALAALTALLLASCSHSDDREVGGPSLGRWQLTELDGGIRSQFGGRPVLCLQGSLERRPAPLYTGPEEVRSWLELRPQGALDFAFYFEDGRDYDVISTDRELLPVGFLDEAFGRGTLRRAASWSFGDRTVEGIVETLPGDGDLRARFAIDGTFEDRGRIAGRWTFQASSDGGNCWGRSVGRGEFRAAAATE